jgi:septum formation protein
MSDSFRSVRFLLASRSPARLATLRAAGIEPEVIVSHVDEEAIEAALPDASPAQLAQVLATAKAEAVATHVTGPALVVGCDSVFENRHVAHRPLRDRHRYRPARRSHRER